MYNVSCDEKGCSAKAKLKRTLYGSDPENFEYFDEDIV